MKPNAWWIDFKNGSEQIPCPTCKTVGPHYCTSPAPDAVSVVVLNDVCEKLLEYMASEKNVFKLRQGMSKIIEAYATTREQKALAPYVEYWEASQAVQQGLVDFDLHNAAVDRLDKATDAIRALKQTNGE